MNFFVRSNFLQNSHWLVIFCKVKKVVVSNFHRTFDIHPITPNKLHPNFMANDRSHKVT